MENPVISFIVPVYNVEPYLERCVASLTAQTYHNLEVVLIDDGSPDRSGAICDALAARDSRIRVVHKQHQGLSVARNTGIQEASGDYICFIDSDDFVAPNMLEVLYQLIQKYSADISICGICDCYGSLQLPQSRVIREFAGTGIDALRDTLKGQDLPGSMCTKLIRSDLCKNLQFRPGKTYEDAFMTPNLLLQADRVAATTQCLYYYWHRPRSITTTPFSSKNMDVIEAYQYTLAEVRKKCPEIQDAALFRVYWAHFVVLDKMLVVPGYQKIPEYTAIVSYLRKNWLQILKCPYFQASRRFSSIMLRINVKLYRILSIANNKRLENNHS